MPRSVFSPPPAQQGQSGNRQRRGHQGQRSQADGRRSIWGAEQEMMMHRTPDRLRFPSVPLWGTPWTKVARRSPIRALSAPVPPGPRFPVPRVRGSVWAFPASCSGDSMPGSSSCLAKTSGRWQRLHSHRQTPGGIDSILVQAVDPEQGGVNVVGLSLSLEYLGNLVFSPSFPP